MSKNTDPRAAGSQQAQSFFRQFWNSFSKSVDEMADHQESKRPTHRGNDKIDADVWHEPHGTGNVPKGRDASASGDDAVEYIDATSDLAEQEGITEAYRKFWRDPAGEIARALRRQVKSESGEADEDAPWSDSEDEDDDETSKGMPKTDVTGLMNVVAGRRQESSIRIPPSFAKAKTSVLADIEQKMQDLPLGKSMLAASLMSQVQGVAEGRLSEIAFQENLTKAPEDVRELFANFDRDPSVKKWTFN